LDGVKKELNTEGVISSSTQFTSLTAPFTGSFTGSFRGNLTGTSSFANTASIVTTNTVSYTAGAGLSGGGTATLGGSSVTIDAVAGAGISLTAPTNDAINIDTASSHFTSGVKSKLNTDGVISSSTQFTSLTAPFTGSFTGSFRGSLTGTGSWAESSSRATTASFAISASYAPGGSGTVTQIVAGAGLTGGTITNSGTITLDTSSVHFLDGVKKELNTEGVVSSSTQFTSLTAPFTGSFTGSFRGNLTGTGSWAHSASIAVTSSFVLPSGLPAGTISSSTQFTSLTAPFTGSFTGSFKGNFSGSLDRFNPTSLRITVGTTAPASPATNDLWVDTN
jgi:hypothetical protein